jgi:predicted dehydrogenase
MKTLYKIFTRLIVIVSFLIICGISGANPMKRTVVIEGAGGALSGRFLTPAILEQEVLSNPNVQIDFYGTELNYDTLPDTGKQTIKTLVAHGMKFIDKSKPQQMQQYQTLAPDYVFLATPPNTHIPLVKAWLAHKNPPKAILVEKPFTENLQELEDLITYTKQASNLKSKILAFDFAEVAFALTQEKLHSIENELGSIDSVQIFMMDNNSGETTDNPLLLTHDDRPITRENRVELLQEGMVLDQMVHIFPPLQHLVDLSTSEITDIKAAQYNNAEIKGETFVAARILAKSKLNGKSIPIATYNGKGIGKIATWDLNTTIKTLMILRGANGKQIWLNLSNSTGSVVDATGAVTATFKLPKNYHAVIENLFLADAEMGQSLEAVLVNLKLARKIKGLIDSHLEQHKFTTYAVGSRKVPAPSLEEILSITPRVYGNGVDQLPADLNMVL